MRRVSLVVVVLAVAACGGGSDGGGTEPPSTETTLPSDTTDTTETTDTTDTTAPMPPPDLSDLEAEARRIVQAAMDDLADRTGAAADAIELVSFEYVTWRNGSLGCPQPGEMYTQALVEGSRTVLQVDGTAYAYHAGNNGDPFLCENPSPGSGTVPSSEK